MTDEKKPENPEVVEPSADGQKPVSQEVSAAPPDPSGVVASVDRMRDSAESSAEHPPNSEEDMLRMLEDLPKDESSNIDDIDFGSQHSVSDAEFQQLSAPAGSGEVRNIEMLMDVNLPVAIELGRTKLAISDILALGPGSVVELNKLAGEPIDVLVNNKPIARGEVVVVDENFGVRITQLLTSEERLRALGES